MDQETPIPRRRTRRVAVQEEQEEPIYQAPITAPVVRKGGAIKKIGFLFLIVVALGGSGFGGWSYYKLQKIQDPNYQKKVVEEKTKSIVDEVGKLMILPEGTPQIATVEDVEQIKAAQPFFEKSMNGDHVLVYDSLAIIYRPSTHMIVNVGPVSRDQSAAAQAETKSAPTASVESTPKKENSTAAAVTATKKSAPKEVDEEEVLEE